MRRQRPQIHQKENHPSETVQPLQKTLCKTKIDASVSLLDTISTHNLTKEMGNEFITDVKLNAFNIPDLNDDKKFSNNKNEIKKALAYIDKHIYKNTQLEEIADHVYLSHYYFSKLFKKEMNVNFITYVNQKKIDRAKIFLIESRMSIEQISRNLGFNQPSYFCKLFKNFDLKSIETGMDIIKDVESNQEKQEYYFEIQVSKSSMYKYYGDLNPQSILIVNKSGIIKELFDASELVSAIVNSAKLKEEMKLYYHQDYLEKLYEKYQH